MASLTILHFNDVYNIEGQKDEPQGGAARMKTYIDSQKNLDPILLFSGDALNPSLSKYVIVMDAINSFYFISKKNVPFDFKSC